MTRGRTRGANDRESGDDGRGDQSPTYTVLPKFSIIATNPKIECNNVFIGLTTLQYILEYLHISH